MLGAAKGIRRLKAHRQLPILKAARATHGATQTIKPALERQSTAAQRPKSAAHTPSYASRGSASSNGPRRAFAARVDDAPCQSAAKASGGFLRGLVECLWSPAGPPSFSSGGRCGGRNRQNTAISDPTDFHRCQ